MMLKKFINMTIDIQSTSVFTLLMCGGGWMQVSQRVNHYVQHHFNKGNGVLAMI